MAGSRLERMDRLVRELSFQDDPDRLIRLLGREDDLLWQCDGLLIVSGRELTPPAYRINRSWLWRDAAGLWEEPETRPVFAGGLLGELIQIGKPVVLDQIELASDDPARAHLEGMASLAAAPGYEHGRPVGLVVLLRHEPAAFTAPDLETLLLNANLINQAAVNLELARRLQETNHLLDEETRKVGRIQAQLLPEQLPTINGLQLGVSYVTSREAGGDYYDVLQLPEDQWGFFVADVSGHGVPAAMVMTMLHTLLHAFPGPPMPPFRVLSHLNRHLLALAPEGMFATAFYAVYDPHYRRLRYASAGHPPPRLRREPGGVRALEVVGGLPLGVHEEESWTEKTFTLVPGDVLLLHTDGILEGTNEAGERFGRQRLDDALRLAPLRPTPLVQHVERQYQEFCDGTPARDDRTLLAVVAVP